MNRFLMSLLISTLWAQTDLDKLVMKDGGNPMIGGSEYLGDYSRTEGMIVYFKPQDALAFQPVPFKLIHTLTLRDGRVILKNGLMEKRSQNTLAYLEYEKLTIQEKAIYNAKRDANKWSWYPPLAALITSVSSGGYFVVTGQNPLESIPAMAIATLSPLTTYSIFNNLDKKSNETINPDEMVLYERTYSAEYKDRKRTNIFKSSIKLGLAAVLGIKGFIESI